MAGSFSGYAEGATPELSGEPLARAIMRDPNMAPVPQTGPIVVPGPVGAELAPQKRTVLRGGRLRTETVIPYDEAALQRDIEANPPGRPPVKLAREPIYMPMDQGGGQWRAPLALPSDTVATQDQVPASLAAPSEPVIPSAPRVAGQVGVSAPIGYGSGIGGYYSPDYVANLVRARNSGQISEKQFDAGVMQYNRAMTGTSAGLELQAGREQAALQQRAGMLDFDTAQKMAEAQAKENEALALTMQQDEERAAAFQERQQQFLRDAERRQNEMDALTAELRASKVDPNQYWQKQNGFSTMLSLFSVGLGGYLEGKTGGRIQNKALGMVENAINRDIEAQKANIDIKGKTLEQMRGAYGVARMRLGDERAAEDYSRALLWDQFANIAKRYKGEARTSELANAAEKIQMQAQSISRTFENQAKVAFARADEARRAAAAAAAASAPERQLRLQERLAALGKTKAETAKLLDEAGVPTAEGFVRVDQSKGAIIPGLGFVAAPPDKAEKVREGATAFQTIDDITGQLINLYKQPGATPNVPGTADYDMRKQLAANLALAVKGKGYADLGVLAGPDMDIITAGTGEGLDGNFWRRSSTAISGLERFRGMAANKFKSTAAQYPIIPGDAQFIGNQMYFRARGTGAPLGEIKEGPARGLKPNG